MQLTMIRIYEIIASMYVCICNAVTERQIRKAAAAGVSTIHELARETGCADCCGTCMEEAERLLQEARGPATLPLPLFRSQPVAL